MLDRAQPVFEFGSFRLDPGQGVLLREGPFRQSPQFRQVEPGLRRTFDALSTRYGTSGPS